jgi:hypothetical protein
LEGFFVDLYQMIMSYERVCKLRAMQKRDLDANDLALFDLFNEVREHVEWFNGELVIRNVFNFIESALGETAALGWVEKCVSYHS